NRQDLAIVFRQMLEECHGPYHAGQAGRPFGAIRLAGSDRRRIRTRAPEPEPVRRLDPGLADRPRAGMDDPAAAGRAVRLPPPRARLFLDLRERRARTP